MRGRFPVAVAGVLLGLLPSPAHAASSEKFTRWSSESQFGGGTSSHVSTTDGTLRLSRPALSSSGHEYGTWTSPWVDPGFGTRTLVPSWNMSTPDETWARIELRVQRGSTTGSWDTMATWASGTSDVRRASAGTQSDDLASVDVDTLISRDGAFDHWQIRVTLFRTRGSTASPAVRSVGGVAATYANRTIDSTSSTTMTSTKVLDVPQYSQVIHRGEFPAYGGGGEAWCSPTTAIMLLRYRKLGPSSKAYAFADKYKNPWVDHAAVNTYDAEYEGTGNWSFTMAYAGRYAHADVIRVHTLRDAERFIRAGTPVGAAIAYGSGELDGAPLNSTRGHLVAVVGFTSSGKVVANDPAGDTNSEVRRTYKRGQFERAWLGGSGGIAYVVRP
jgi:hypothetical protein